MVLRLVLGALFVAMAAGQLASLRQMPGILAEYGLVAGPAAAVLAVALIVGELVCGVWFLARPRSRALAPVLVFTGVAVVWALLAVQAFARGLTVANCGCFGIYLVQRLSWFVLVQDALLLLYAGVLLRTALGTAPATAAPPTAASGGGAGSGAGSGAGTPDRQDPSE
ncbi:MauE/DoxX family redox-associated membrane protein [Streptomyces tirandamycinicus]|uniref:MauE/DoxX family redox-associated membrane protein n=1 Tax=Streptomyces tirandamycinicus TaxID=2174846 RepID=UPI003431531C